MINNISQLRQNLNLTYKLSCTYIDKEIQLVNRNGEKFVFSDILLDSISHILFIPPMFCSSCNEKILQILPDVVELFADKLKVISYPSDVNTIINYLKNKISHKNLFVTKEQIIKGYENINNIYILSITNLGQIKSIFLISDTDLKSFEGYIKFCLKGN